VAARAEAPRCVWPIDIAKARSADPSCVLNEHASGTRGTLTLPCGDADGPAAAEFATTRFQGEVKHGILEIVVDEEYEWQDGCRWRATQRIRGTTDHPRWLYKYSEEPVRGTQCLGACTALSFVHVERTDAGSPGLGHTDD
jgi:hypothetical protein